MNIISFILKTKIPFSLALLAITALAVNAEQLFLQSIKANHYAYDAVATISSTPAKISFNSWPSDIKEKVALTGANVPLIPGAKRLTFNDGYAVRYRINASADFVTDFYRQILASQGWKTAARTSANAKLEKLTIAYAENPLSKKTDIAYAYVPANGVKVLGVKIAETDAPLSQPIQPAQPLPDGQYQPQGSTQPINQPTMNQMEFSRPPTQPFFGDQKSGQTCRINDVEMPGPCEQYNNQNQGSGGQGDRINQGGQQNGQFNNQNQGPRGPGGQMGQPGQQGPSEEDQIKMDERRFKDMKKGLSQFASGAKMMKKNITRIKTANSKCGVGMPEELENALAQTDNLIGKINAAKTADELDEIIGDIQDVGSVMQDWGPRMGDLNRLCQMLKQADREAKQFDRNVKRIETQVKANKKVDLSELLAEYKTAVSAQKDVLAQVKELAKTDPESALAKIEDDFYGNMDNLGNLQMQIDAIVNLTKGLNNITRELNTFASQIKTLAKKKVATAEMQELLNTLKTQVAEIKDLIKNKADAEELVSKIEEVFDARQELQDVLQENDLVKTMPQISAGSNYNIKVNLPEVFRKAKNTGDNDESAEERISKPIPTNPGPAGSGDGAGL